MNRIIIGCFLLVSTLSAFAGAEAQEFPIYCWTYMRFEEQTRPVEQIVKDWKDLGITHPLMPGVNGKTDKAAVRHMLDLCHAAGLHAIMTDDRVDNAAIFRLIRTRNVEEYRKGVREALADWGSHPGVGGFYMFDEPVSNHVNGVCVAARVCREEDPSKIWYVNLLPWYSWIGPSIGSAAYAPYLDKVAEKSGLPMLSYDCYSQQNEVNGAKEGVNVYFENLREWMEVTLRRPGFGYTVTQVCVPHHNNRLDSIDDFRWQINTAAAMGAKGINWFYPDMSSKVQGIGENYREAPINVFGERTQTYQWMSTELRIFQREYGSEFMRLQIESAWMTGATWGGVKAFAKDSDPDVWGVSSADPVLVSFFHDAEGVRYMAAVNLSRRTSRHIHYVFNPDVKPQRRLFTQKYEPLRTATDAVGARTAGERAPNRAANFLAPGQMLLVKLVKETKKEAK